MSPHDGLLDRLVLPTANAEAMSGFLAEVALRPLDEFIRMVLEGARGHRAKRLQRPAHRRLILWPPWSPPLNPVEHLGDDVPEQWFRHRVLASLSAVEQQRVTARLALEADPLPVVSLAGFPWIIPIPLKAN